MSERLGHVTFDAPRQGVFLNGPPELAQRAAYSERTAQLIDEEISKLISEAHARVARTLTDKRSTLETLARLLLKHEVVERAMLDEVLRGAETAAPGAPEAAQVPLAAASALANLAQQPADGAGPSA